MESLAFFMFGVFVGGTIVGIIWAVRDIIEDNKRTEELSKKASDPTAHYIGRKIE